MPLLDREGVGRYGEIVLPGIAFRGRLVVFKQFVNGVVALGSADAGLELEADNRRVLPQEPFVGLRRGQARAVYT